MPECQNCGRYFHISHRICPKCEAYEAPEEEFLQYVRSKAESELETGAEPYLIRKQLIENGLASEHADSVVADAVDLVSGRIRRQGVKRIISGAAIALAGTISALTFFVNTGRLSEFYWLAAAGAVVATYGIKAIGSGLHSLVSGRDLPQKTLE